LRWADGKKKRNSVVTQAQDGPFSGRSIPKAKQTALGLYVTAQQAYDEWKANPKQVKILDVRTPEEYVFVGHAEMAWNIPLALQTYQWDAGRVHLQMKPNPEFLALAKEVFSPSDVVMVMCRSGGRSATSVNLLAQGGFKQVYNIIDGMEGDAVNDPESTYHGKRLKNGWKNSGLPWTYALDPKLMRLPSTTAETRSTTAV
jgi:rhodanese-related sulfurtransferase